MSQNKVDIINSALTDLGSKLIEDVNTTEPNGRAAVSNFSVALRAVLRSYDWNCCKLRTTLAAEVATPDHDWTAQFTLPADFIRVVEVDDCRVPYSIEGGKLLSDEASHKLVYIADPEKTTNNLNIVDLDPLAAEAVAGYLAWKISFKVTGSMSTKRALWDNYRAILKSAKTADSADNLPAEIDVYGPVEERTL